MQIFITFSYQDASKNYHKKRSNYFYLQFLFEFSIFSVFLESKNSLFL